MAKKRRHKEKHNKRKKHNASNFMPAIEPKPTLNRDNIDSLPQIIIDCSVELSNGDISKVKDRLNFTNHRDLRKLNGVRIVDPDSIKTKSKESTTGCYYPEHSHNKAEIWLTSDLIKRRNGFENFIERVVYKDRLFETLFHEIGHHKAKLIHSVDKFENEAYAEKYMLAYRKFWKKHYGPSKIYKILFKIITRCIRFILICILYPFRNKNEDINLFYRNLKGEITFKEYVDETTKSVNTEENGMNKRKKKWTHPLNDKKYRERFKLPD